MIGAARVTDVEENSDSCAEEEFGKTDAENTEENHTIDEDEIHSTREYDTVSDEDETVLVEPTPNAQSSLSDIEGGVAEIQLPSAILQYFEEP